MAEKQGFDLAEVLGDMSNLDTQQGPLAFAYDDIHNIHPDPYNAKVYTLSDLGGLMDAILLEGGLQQPLYVVRDGKGWKVKSGHRRHAALMALVEGSDKYPPHPELRLVPLVYRPESDTEDLARVTSGDMDDDKAKQLTQLMGELRVLIGNMGNRKQSDAELSAAAQELESHYAALAELGVSFPGRLRDRVAAACQVSASKLARLKVIRDKLAPENYRKLWEQGEIKEQAAYAIARMEPIMQETIAKYKPRSVPTGEICERILKYGMQEYLGRSTTCPDGSPCTNGEQRLAHDVRLTCTWDMCHDKGKCCLSCYQRDRCKFACQAAKDKVAGEKAQREEDRKKASTREERNKKARKNKLLAFAERLGKFVKTRKEFENLRKGVSKRAAYQTSALPSRYLVSAMFDADVDAPPGEYYIYPGAEELRAICQITGASADYLLGLTDEPMRGTGEKGAKK